MCQSERDASKITTKLCMKITTSSEHYSIPRGSNYVTQFIYLHLVACIFYLLVTICVKLIIYDYYNVVWRENDDRYYKTAYYVREL